MKNSDLLEAVLPLFVASPHVEGIFHYGALARQAPDAYSDIDLGVASRSNGESFDEVCRLAERAVRTVIEPVSQSDNRWGYSWMLSALYGSDAFPPIGTELDLIVLRLEHVAEQMPYATYRVIFDRRGALQSELDELRPPKPDEKVKQEIGEQLEVYPIFAFNALKASRRGDTFRLQMMLQEMRKPIFYAAAARHGEQVFGAKQVGRFLNAAEQEVLEQSYFDADEGTVAAIAAMYLSMLQQLPDAMVLQEEVDRLGVALSAFY